jgi:hypothetical protein
MGLPLLPLARCSYSPGLSRLPNIVGKCLLKLRGPDNRSITKRMWPAGHCVSHVTRKTKASNCSLIGS